MLILPFMKPNGLPHVSPLLNDLYTVLMVVSFSVIMLRVLKRHVRLNMYIYLLAALMGWLVVRTFFSGGQTGPLLEITMRMVGLSILIQVYSKKVPTLIRSFFINFELIIYLNFICLLLFPHGMYISSQNGNRNNWLLGYDNHWFIVYFGACFILICYAYYYDSIVRPFLLFLVIHVSSLIVMSGAIIIGLMVIDVIWLFKIYKLQVFSYRTIWIATIIINLLVLTIGSSGIIDFIAYTLLRKSATTLLSRRRIWETTLLSIRNHFLLGVGRPVTADRIALYHNRHASNAHNFFLEIFYEGGLVAMVLLSSIVVFAGRQIKRYADNIIVRYLLIALLACTVTGAIDSFLEDRGYMFFALLSFASIAEMFSKKRQ